MKAIEIQREKQKKHGKQLVSPNANKNIIMMIKGKKV